MTPIIITVGERKLEIEDQDHLDNWLEKKLKVQSLVDLNGVEHDRFARLLNAGSYTLGPAIQPPQQQQPPNWFKVSGAISQPVSHAGARLELYKLAAAHGGLYPRDHTFAADKRLPFSTANVEDVEGDRTIVSFAAVFQDLQQAFQFINGITLYIKRNQDQLVLLNDEGSRTDTPACAPVPLYQINESDMILQVHYKPNTGEAEGDPGSPLIDMVVDVRSSCITVDEHSLETRSYVSVSTD